VKKYLLIILILLFLFLGCGVSTTKYELQIISPTFSATQIPLKVPINLPEDLSNQDLSELDIRIKAENEGEFPGQILKDSDGKFNLHFVIPSLQEGVTQSLAVLVQQNKSTQPSFQLDDKETKYLDFLFAGRKICRYMYEYDVSTPERMEATNKPFFHLFDLSGRYVITNGSGGLYPHHRGLFIGWQRIECGEEVFNFWSMEDGAHQKHIVFVENIAGPVLAILSAEINWSDKNSTIILKELRRVTLYKQPAPTVLLMKFESTISPPACDINLLGNAEHAGFQFRAHNDVAEGYVQGVHDAISGNQPKVSYFFPKENIDLTKEVDLPWTALSYILKGKKYNIQHINTPENPKNTMYSAYRDYGRFGAAFNTSLKRGESLHMTYYIWAVEGETPVIAEFNAKYAGLTTNLNINFVQ
jgi:hypothetical protein